MADPIIPTIKLGSQGLKVSKLGFGCMGLTGTYNAPVSEDEGIAIIKHAFEKGITFFDTADAYGANTNEILVGKALKQFSRERIQLATKFGIVKIEQGSLIFKGTPEYARKCCEASLKRLDVDYIDLYYQHRVDKSVPIEETMYELKKLVEEGKIKYIGLSEAQPDTIRRVHAVHPITALQMEWSLWDRDIEEEIVPLCRELGIGIVPYSPLGRGFFGGKAILESLPTQSQLVTQPRFSGENFSKNKSIFTRVSELATNHGCTSAQLALSWVLRQGEDVAPIPVCLCPPSAIPSLYQSPLYGESSNHSAVDIEHPDFSIHPRAKELAHCSHHVALAAGDALFIPEGWFHQVDSSDLTIAVNFWWQSDITLAMKEHMDGYYLRIILKRLMDNEMKRELNGNYEENRNSEEKTSCQPSEREQEDAGCSSFREAKPCVIPSSPSHNDFETKQSACTRNLDWKGQQLEPEASQILHQQVSVVHEKVTVSSQGQMVYSDASQNGSNRVCDQTLSECEPVFRTEEHSFSLGNDPVACILRSVEPLTLQRVFCVMVQSFPRTLEALVLHVLSPPAAEILTQKFDEMDEFTTKEEQMHFYRLLYGIFEDQGAAMDAILNGKEAFGFQVLRNVLHQHLGVMCHRTGNFSVDVINSAQKS